MEPYTVHRPDEAAIRRILEKHPYDAVGMAVRLACTCRFYICLLTF